MWNKILLYTIFFILYLFSYIIISFFIKKDGNFDIYQKIVFYIFKFSSSTTFFFIMLLIILRKIFLWFNLINYKTVKVMVTGVLLMSIALQIIAFLNLKYISKRKDESN